VTQQTRTLAHIEDLIANSVREDKTIEYKREIPRDRLELLKDVSAFANTSGGELIFGIEEEKGVPTRIVGLPLENADAEVLRLQQIIGTGLQPPLILSSLDCKVVPLSDGTQVIVLHIPKSLAGPHQIRETFVFWGRHSGGTYRLDTGELRRAFVSSAALTDSAVEYRAQRISRIKVGSRPVAIAAGPKVILHLLPASVFSPGEAWEVSLSHPTLKKFTALEDPQSGGSKGSEIDEDGLTNYAGAKAPYRAYTQVQRSGAVEAVMGLKQDLREVKVEEGKIRGIDKINFIAADFYESLILQAVPQYLKLLGELGIPFPVFMFLSLTDVGGCYILASQHVRERGSSGLYIFVDDLEGHHPIDCEDLLLPQVVIEDGTPDKIQKLLHHQRERVWNASGVAVPPPIRERG
jgi:Putative DNA-binding domain